MREFLAGLGGAALVVTGIAPGTAIGAGRNSQRDNNETE